MIRAWCGSGTRGGAGWWRSVSRTRRTWRWRVCALRRRDVTIVTQNVDGLHARAAREASGGSDPTAALPLEVHGSLLRDRCSVCEARSEPVPVDATSAATLPRCVRCSGLLRPDVVWFGEMLDEDILSAADAAASSADVVSRRGHERAGASGGIAATSDAGERRRGDRGESGGDAAHSRRGDLDSGSCGG